MRQDINFTYRKLLGGNGPDGAAGGFGCGAAFDEAAGGFSCGAAFDGAAGGFGVAEAFD